MLTDNANKSVALGPLESPKGFWAFVLLTAVAMTWPALVNRGPFWFPDTSNYIRAADAAVVYLVDSPSEWSNRLGYIEPDREGSDASQPAATADKWSSHVRPTRPVLSGRSVYYGLLIYLPMRFFGPWGSLLLQSVLTALTLLFCIKIILREARVRTSAMAWAILATIVLFTSLPYYVSMLMPDIFSGCLIVLLATTISFWHCMARWERYAAVGSSAAFVTFHTSHLLLTLSVAVAAIVIMRGRRHVVQTLSALIIVGSIGVIATAAQTYAVKRALGAPPLAPPFLSARLSDSGPGATYLENHCDATRGGPNFELCRFRQRLPLDSDAFLWGTDNKSGLFQTADSRSQRLIANQDKRFFLAVVKAYPREFVEASLHAFFEIMFKYDLDNFNYSWSPADYSDQKYPDDIANQIRSTRAAAHVMPVRFTVISTAMVAFISAITLLITVVGTIRRRLLLPGAIIRFAMLTIFALLANMMICAALSKPHSRYQMRAVWLLPFASIAVLMSTRRRSLFDEKQGAAT